MLKKTMFPGILGMTLIISALMTEDLSFQRWAFFLGALGMTMMAVLEKHRLFIGLQVVIISGTLAAFLPLGDNLKGFIPCFISIPVIYTLYQSKVIDNWVNFLGALALTSLGVGFALQSTLIFFLGGLLITVFSFLELRSGFRPAIIWLILNLTFTLLNSLSLLP